MAFGRAVKWAGATVVVASGYYLYKSKFNINRAEVLAHQDFERISKATSDKFDKLEHRERDQYSLERLGETLDEKVTKSKNELERNANEKKQQLRQQSQQQSQGLIDWVKSWFK